LRTLCAREEGSFRFFFSAFATASLGIMKRTFMPSSKFSMLPGRLSGCLYMDHPNKRVLDELKDVQKGIERILAHVFTMESKSKPPDTPKQYSVNAIHKDDSSEHKGDDPEGIIRATFNMPKAIRVEAETHERKNPWFKDVALWVQIAIAVAAFAYATINYLQWSDSISNFRLDQRAWVGIDFPILSAGRGEDKKLIKLTIQASLKNTGKTPALTMSIPRTISVMKPVDEVINYDKEWENSIAHKKQQVDANKKVLETDKTSGVAQMLESFIEAEEKRWNGEGLALAPGSTAPINLVKLTDPSIPDPNLDPQYQRPKGQAIYWIGRITYRDIFSNKIHTTKFCLWYFSTTLETCPGGNSMD
jgi:hypothetical protein